MKKQENYTKFALVNEMFEAVDVIKDFHAGDTEGVIDEIKKTSRLFFTGEGSSRTFPSKNAIEYGRKCGMALDMASEGSYQACEYDLNSFVVFAASNSGKTKETLTLFDGLKTKNHSNLYGLTANKNTPLEQFCKQTFVLGCGSEDAIAATKSSVEQALFYQSLLAKTAGGELKNLDKLAPAFEEALTVDIPVELTKALAGAETIYFAGRNNGLAEELAVKVNEIVRKKSDYLEGTSYMHGIQEVMSPKDVVILIDPYRSELKKTREIMIDQVGLKVFVIAMEDTMFPTIKVAELGELTNYLYLAVGWNVLVEAGINLGIDLDKAERAQKVGNVFGS
ncbi:MAG: sugar isomerase [Planctomycetes bacterium]|nr:sugar isomerase [Planctomycetota bacterium]